MAQWTEVIGAPWASALVDTVANIKSIIVIIFSLSPVTVSVICYGGWWLFLTQVKTMLLMKSHVFCRHKTSQGWQLIVKKKRNHVSKPVLNNFNNIGFHVEITIQNLKYPISAVLYVTYQKMPWNAQCHATYKQGDTIATLTVIIALCNLICNTNLEIHCWFEQGDTIATLTVIIVLCNLICNTNLEIHCWLKPFVSHSWRSCFWEYKNIYVYVKLFVIESHKGGLLLFFIWLAQEMHAHSLVLLSWFVFCE